MSTRSKKTAASPAETPEAVSAPAAPARKRTSRTATAAAADAAVTPGATTAAAAETTATASAAEKPAPKTAAKTAKAGATSKGGAKRGRKPAKKAEEDVFDDAELGDLDDDLVDEEVEAVTDETAEAEPTEKAKPLRMKLSKAKERALMKEFGLDDTVLTEEEAKLRREKLKQLIKLGKTRGYLTHGEINDHLPDKLVEQETLEVVVSLLNDMGVAVYDQTPDAETLLLTGAPTAVTTEEEAEEEAEAALSTVDSEFGRTTDPVRMYMREMGT
ncbi:RNA polymerase sigma factor region1.1 domain-containing protein, partial [Tepidimonas sp.]